MDLKYMLIWIWVLLNLMNLILCTSKYDDGEIRPYEFGFILEGNQHRHEKKDINGIITGEFGFVTGDGIYHLTAFATDKDGHFNVVSMENVKIEEYIKSNGNNFNIPKIKAKGKLLIEVAPVIRNPKQITITPCSSCYIDEQDDKYKKANKTIGISNRTSNLNEKTNNEFTMQTGQPVVNKDNAMLNDKQKELSKQTNNPKHMTAVLFKPLLKKLDPQQQPFGLENSKMNEGELGETLAPKLNIGNIITGRNYSAKILENFKRINNPIKSAERQQEFIETEKNLFSIVDNGSRQNANAGNSPRLDSKTKLVDNVVANLPTKSNGIINATADGNQQQLPRPLQKFVGSVKNTIGKTSNLNVPNREIMIEPIDALKNYNSQAKTTNSAEAPMQHQRIPNIVQSYVGSLQDSPESNDKSKITITIADKLAANHVNKPKSPQPINQITSLNPSGIGIQKISEERHRSLSGEDQFFDAEKRLFGGRSGDSMNVNLPINRKLNTQTIDELKSAEKPKDSGGDSKKTIVPHNHESKTKPFDSVKSLEEQSKSFQPIKQITPLSPIEIVNQKVLKQKSQDAVHQFVGAAKSSRGEGGGDSMEANLPRNRGPNAGPFDEVNSFEKHLKPFQPIQQITPLNPTEIFNQKASRQQSPNEDSNKKSLSGKSGDDSNTANSPRNRESNAGPFDEVNSFEKQSKPFHPIQRITPLNPTEIFNQKASRQQSPNDDSNKKTLSGKSGDDSNTANSPRNRESNAGPFDVVKSLERQSKQFQPIQKITPLTPIDIVSQKPSIQQSPNDNSNKKSLSGEIVDDSNTAKSPRNRKLNTQTLDVIKSLDEKSKSFQPIKQITPLSPFEIVNQKVLKQKSPDAVHQFVGAAKSSRGEGGDDSNTANSPRNRESNAGSLDEVKSFKKQSKPFHPIQQITPLNPIEIVNQKSSRQQSPNEDSNKKSLSGKRGDDSGTANLPRNREPNAGSFDEVKSFEKQSKPFHPIQQITPLNPIEIVNQHLSRQQSPNEDSNKKSLSGKMGDDSSTANLPRNRELNEGSFDEVKSFEKQSKPFHPIQQITPLKPIEIVNQKSSRQQSPNEDSNKKSLSGNNGDDSNTANSPRNRKLNTQTLDVIKSLEEQSKSFQPIKQITPLSPIEIVNQKVLKQKSPDAVHQFVGAAKSSRGGGGGDSVEANSPRNRESNAGSFDVVKSLERQSKQFQPIQQITPLNPTEIFNQKASRQQSPNEDSNKKSLSGEIGDDSNTANLPRNRESKARLFDTVKPIVPKNSEEVRLHPKAPVRPQQSPVAIEKSKERTKSSFTETPNLKSSSLANSPQKVPKQLNEQRTNHAIKAPADRAAAIDRTNYKTPNNGDLAKEFLYKFNFTVGYYGHNERGDSEGRKDGSFFFLGRDGLERTVQYVANEFGFQPYLKLKKVPAEDIPTESEEKQTELKGYEFIWYR